MVATKVVLALDEKWSSCIPSLLRNQVEFKVIRLFVVWDVKPKNDQLKDSKRSKRNTRNKVTAADFFW